MANALCVTTINALNSPNKQGFLIGGSNAPRVIRMDNNLFRSSKTVKPHSATMKASDGDQPAMKPVVNSIVCPDCEGNGAVLCSQCKGNGVNSVDHFNGQFKAGGLCWLCRGKKDMLCGSCNGAGFRGGFMSTQDE